jgi:acyl-CoA thioesterase I
LPASLIGFETIPAAAQSVVPCVAPADLTRFDLPLKRTADRLDSRGLITIVALGSSSTAGAGASSPTTTYPNRLLVELRRLFPSQPLAVLNRGVNGELAVDMLDRFDRSVAAEHPDLVLWQVGTNAVLRDRQTPLTSSLIHDGIRRMKSIGADVVLIDPQFAPKVIIKPAITTMIDLISAAAEEMKVNVFHRFALMRHWHEVNGMPFQVFVSSDGLHMSDWSYGCLAKLLADAIAGAATTEHAKTSIH